MIVVNPGSTLGPAPAATPALVFIGQNQGRIVPSDTLSYRILDCTTPDKQNAGGVQVYPPSGKQVVDLDADAVRYDPNALAGVYAARWPVPADEPHGRHEIEWTWTLTTPASSIFTSIATEPSPSGVARQAFDVGSSFVPSTLPLYVLPSELREEMCCGKDVSDARLVRVIALASRMIERVTGRFFEPRQQFLRLGGNSMRGIGLGPPIIGVSSVGIDTEPTQAGDLVVELDLLRIYNRHLSQGLTSPDDRNSPRIEFVHSDDLYGVRFVPFRGISLRSLAWPIGVQNVHVRGLFGYTDPDGTPWGMTPLLIQHVTKLIAARELPKIGDRDAREDAQWRWRVTADKAKDIEVDMVAPRKWGEFFGDPEIDSILCSFVRPPAMGAV